MTLPVQQANAHLLDMLDAKYEITSTFLLKLLQTYGTVAVESLKCCYTHLNEIR
jgi:hypothetical protein